MTKVTGIITQKGVAGIIAQKGVAGSITQKGVTGSIVSSSGQSWSAYWTALISAVVENAAPTKAVLTSGSVNTSFVVDDFIVRSTADNFITGMADLGITVDVNHPAARHYNGKTYIAYFGNDDDPYIVSYNHSTNLWATPVQIGTNPVANGDAHGEPIILIDQSGYIHCFFGCHDTAMQYAKSNTPENITAWTAQTSPDAFATYPQVHQLSDGTIYLFFRGRQLTNVGWGFRTSADNGATWSAFTKIIDTHVYINTRKGASDIIHLSYIYAGTNSWEQRNNVNYLYIESGVCKRIDGTTITLPLTDVDDSALVYDSGANIVPYAVVNSDSENNPFILFSEGTDEAGVYNYKVAKHNGVSWDIVSTGASTLHWRNMASAIDVRSALLIDLYLVVSTVGVGGDIEKWVSTDGGATWSKSSTIASGTFYVPVLVEDYNRFAKVVFSQYKGDGLWTNNGYLYGDGGYVKVNKTIASLSRDATNKILTLTLQDAVLYTDTIEVVLLKNDWLVSAITNNTEPAYEAESSALFARMVTAEETPDLARKIIINTCIAALKTNSLWAKFDGFWLMAAHGALSSRMNWIGASYNLTDGGTPTFTIDRGQAGNGTSMYLKTGISPVAGGFKFARDDAAYGLYCRTAAGTLSMFPMGSLGAASVGRSTILPRSTANFFQAYVNVNTVTSVANSDGTGLYAAVRNTSTTVSLYKNKVKTDANTTSSGLAPEYYILASNNNDTAPTGYSTIEIAFAFMGSKLTEAEVGLLYDIIVDGYLASVGAKI